MNEKLGYIIAVLVALIIVSGVYAFENKDAIYYSIYGDIEDNQVHPILTSGRLLGPVLWDQRWVSAYTIGYANSTNRFYIRYEFTYDLMPHKLQYTKWQNVPKNLIRDNWDLIETFGGSWLPEEAYCWREGLDTPSLFTIGKEGLYTCVYEGEYLKGEAPLFKSLSAQEAIEWAMNNPSKSRFYAEERQTQ